MDTISFLKSERLVENKWPLFVGLATYYCFVYFVTNRFPLYPDTYLPLTPADEAIPLIPWTSWIYISVYVYPAVVGYYLNTRESIIRSMMNVFLMVTVAGVIFTFSPTAILRPGLSPAENDLGLQIIRFLDAPRNCFPSLHVAVALGLAMAIGSMGSKHTRLFYLWSILIILSTWTTKQHYVVDALGGIFLAIVCSGLASFLIRKLDLR